ncbi:MAG: glycoside hydrolase family 3 protein [Phototrophicaceae bacterium]
MHLNKLLWVSVLLIALLPVYAQTNDEHSEIEQLSLEQKVGQMFVMSFFGSQLNIEATDLLASWQPGAVVLLPSNLETPQQITQLTNAIQSTLVANDGLPAFIAVDQEGGIIAHLEEGFTRWAVPSLLTATQNPDLAYEFGQALGTELRAVGINMNLAPVADLQTNLDNPIIGRRSFGHDPALVSPIIASVIDGMQDNGVMATVKHFPGHGDTVADSHLELPLLNLSQDDLLQRELLPFISAIEADTGAVMVAHIYFPQIDSESDTPSSLSSNIINGILRDTLNYQGLVITDALDMDAIDTVYSPAEAAIRAIEAGNDLILLGAHISPQNQIDAMQAVVDAVRAGIIAETRIDASVNRILQAKDRFNIFDWQSLDPNQADTRIDRENHMPLIDRMFEQGITRVHDNGNMFPLSGRTLMIYPISRSTLGLACNRNAWQFLTVSQQPTSEEIAAAVQAAQFVDNVIVFTENVRDNTQQSVLLRQLPLMKTSVVALWSPFDSLYLPATASHFITYSPLPQSYTPICDILHGEAQALGTLSVMLEAQ